jgi:hypothetical protein
MFASNYLGQPLQEDSFEKGWGNHRETIAIVKEVADRSIKIVMFRRSEWDIESEVGSN